MPCPELENPLASSRILFVPLFWTGRRRSFGSQGSRGLKKLESELHLIQRGFYFFFDVGVDKVMVTNKL